MKSPDGIRAILFDLDGTLRHSRPPYTGALLDQAVRLGAPDSQESRHKATRWSHYYWAQSPELLDDLDHFPEQDDLFWSKYIYRQLIHFDCRPELVDRLAPLVFQYMKNEHRPEDWVPAEVIPTLQDLIDAGYRLGVVTNRRRSIQDLMQAIGLSPYFELVIVAAEVDSWKPEPDIFRYALQQMKIQPHQAFYIGDNYYADVIGARNAGLHPVLIDPDRIYPEPGCPVIQSIDDIPGLLDLYHPEPQ